MIGLIIIINKNNCQDTLTFDVNTIDEAKNKLISILVNNFKDMNIDFPLLISDFEYLWFNEEAKNLPVFTYKIYNNNWDNPWDEQEIYTDVLEQLYELEINTSHNMLDYYIDEESNIDNKYIDLESNNNTKYTDYELMMKEIINNS
jgi:hypothetical protein